MLLRPVTQQLPHVCAVCYAAAAAAVYVWPVTQQLPHANEYQAELFCVPHGTLHQHMTCGVGLQQRALRRTAAAALDGVWLLP